MHLYGFQHLAGADPFVPADNEVAPGVPVWKKFHAELEGRYDWIMLHHSFEHMPDPQAVLHSCRRLLTERGRVLVRMPIMGKAAWRKYGTNWMAIDAPRHLVVYTTQGFATLASLEGFRVDQTFYESTDFQFWASEAVAAGRPWAYGPSGDYSQEQFAAWRREAIQLNQQQDGDLGGYVLTPV
jgi:hypothetical protein